MTDNTLRIESPNQPRFTANVFVATAAVSYMCWSGRALTRETAFVLLLCLAVLSFRHGVDVSRGLSRVTRWWGFGWPWLRRERELTGCDGVVVRSRVIKARNGRRTRLVVAAKCAEGEVRLLTTVEYLEARQTAEHLCARFGVDLIDQVAGGPSTTQLELLTYARDVVEQQPVRPLRSLPRGVADKVDRQVAQALAQPRPWFAGALFLIARLLMRSVYGRQGIPLLQLSEGRPRLTHASHNGSTLIVEIPPAHRIGAYAVAFGLGIAAIVCYRVLHISIPPLILAGIAAGAAALLAWAEYRRSARHLLEVSAQGIEVTTRWTFGRSHRTFAAPAILQVDVIPGYTISWSGASIVMRDARHIARVGNHVPVDELQLIVAQIRKVLPLDTPKQRSERDVASNFGLLPQSRPSGQGDGLNVVRSRGKVLVAALALMASAIAGYYIAGLESRPGRNGPGRDALGPYPTDRHHVDAQISAHVHLRGRLSADGMAMLSGNSKITITAL